MMPRASIPLPVVSFFVVVAFASACATTHSSTDEFLTAGRDLAEARTPTASRRSEPRAQLVSTDVKRPSPREEATSRAASYRDDIDCSRAVRLAEAAGQRTLAWELVVACARTGKWRNLQRMFDPPFGARLAALPKPEALELVARVIATRGGMFEADLPLVRRGGYRLTSLQDAAARQLPAGTWVIFRASVDQERRVRGKRVAELVEIGRRTQDRKGRVDHYDRSGRMYLGSEYSKVASSDLFDETGTIVEAKLPDSVPFLGSGQFIFAARFQGFRSDEDMTYALVDVVEAYTPGTITFDIAR